MTMGHEVSSGVLEFSTNSSLPIAVSVEDSTRGLLKAIQAEPLLALAGSGPNDEPQDSGTFYHFLFVEAYIVVLHDDGLRAHLLHCVVEGSTRTPTDSTKLASGAQRVLLAVLPLLRGYFDSCGLFLQSFDARNWPLCASILELENCPVEVRLLLYISLVLAGGEYTQPTPDVYIHPSIHIFITFSHDA